METKIEKLEKSQVKLEIKIEASKLDESIRKVYYRNASNYIVPGFRRGKAPQMIIERYYGADVFLSDALNMLIPDAYDEAVKNKGLYPVTSPEFNIEKLEKGSDLIFTATVTVRPEVTLGEYKGIEAVKNSVSITDEDVQKELERVAETNSRTIPVEGRGAMKGDSVNIDFEGFIDENPFEGGKAENHTLVLGSGSFIPGFEDQIEGKETGQEFDVNVTFPDDYHAQDLAGKPAVFKVKLNEIRVKEVPAIDDEFAKDVSEFDNLDDYKKSIREKLEETAENAANRQFENAVVEKAVSNATVEIPDVMILNNIDRMIAETESNLRYYNITMDDYLKNMGMTMEDFIERQKDNSEREIRTQLVIDKIREVEGVTVEEDEIEKEIENNAERAGRSKEDFLKQVSEGYRDYIKYQLEVEKVVKMLVDNAKQIDKPTDADNEENAATETETVTESGAETEAGTNA